MSVATACKVKKPPLVKSRVHAGDWTEPGLRQSLWRLFHETVGAPPIDPLDKQALEAMMHLTSQPAIQQALQQRRERDRTIVLRDVATRYAFAQLYQQRRSICELDALSRSLIRRTLDSIYHHAARIAQQIGEDPLDVDPELWLYFCKSIATYVPRKPLDAHIAWKLQHYESAVSRAMRQIKTLTTHPAITEAFVAYVLESSAPMELQAHLLQIARGGGLRGADYAAIIRFFAAPETLSFVKRFASTVQTAYTLYARSEYNDVIWRGRKLRANVRWGYLEAALAQLQPATEESLDADTFDLHSLVADAQDVGMSASEQLHRESFEVWIARCAHEHYPEDPLWQVAYWRYVAQLAPEAILAQGLATPDLLATAQAHIETLRADADIWRLWLQSRIS
ncbi:MAG: hypothetical protein JXA21_00160 [Anaerolineae bacterium]|nr:hypothetical protein [Anaerolineae bacterium]